MDKRVSSLARAYLAACEASALNRAALARAQAAEDASRSEESQAYDALWQALDRVTERSLFHLLARALVEIAELRATKGG